MTPPNLAPSLILFVIIFWGSVVFGEPIFWHCQDDWGLYKNGSTYEYNLKQLVTWLASNASAASDGFYNSTVGIVGSPDQIYGSIMCYADTSRTDCLDCLKAAANEVVNLTTKCSYRKTAITHYESCFLHYSNNQSVFSITQDFDPKCLQTDADNSLPGFLGVPSVVSLISSVTRDASNLDRKYASNMTNYIEDLTSKSIYVLVQCARDLVADECTKCVQNYLAYANATWWCQDMFGAQINGPNCYIRFENFPFNTGYTAASPPPPVPVLPPSKSPAPPALRPSKPTASPSVPHSKGSISTTIVAVSVPAGLLFLSAAIFVLWNCRRGKKQNRTEEESPDTNLQLILNPSAEYQVFELRTLRNATNNFSDKNKLGQGGFGPVYKGRLTNGQEMAVKTLSGTSKQGLRELKNEVEFLAKVKHKNLVQLLGCCIEKKEKILCYEFLPNGSLDKILFAKDSSKRLELDWKVRYKIIEGIARGLHYLHEESRLKIIHRDLKASNILLDKDMSPKISDFGLARFFGEDQTHIDTSVIAGTYGYIAPEYVMHGNFSTKSDVYSFGVLILEIVMGQSNSSIASSGRAASLVSHAWQLCKNNTIEELKDPMLEDVYLEEIIKCVHVALLCVQQEPSIRPNMGTVNRMLTGGAIPSFPPAQQVPVMDVSFGDENSMAVRSLLMEQRSENNNTYLE